MINGSKSESSQGYNQHVVLRRKKISEIISNSWQMTDLHKITEEMINTCGRYNRWCELLHIYSAENNCSRNLLILNGLKMNA